jgi:hypothetical protein
MPQPLPGPAPVSRAWQGRKAGGGIGFEMRCGDGGVPGLAGQAGFLTRSRRDTVRSDAASRQNQSEETGLASPRLPHVQRRRRAEVGLATGSLAISIIDREAQELTHFGRPRARYRPRRGYSHWPQRLLATNSPWT